MNKPWFPMVNAEQCDECGGAQKCVRFCPYNVFEVIEGKPFVANPLNCIYGCSSCAKICGKKAIVFPVHETVMKEARKDSVLHRVTCSKCGKKFLTDRNTCYCFDCEAEMGRNGVGIEH